MSDPEDLTEAISNALGAIEPLIREIARWPHVDAQAYAVVITTTTGDLLSQLIVSDHPREEWAAPFDDVARRKAALSARTGLPARAVFQDRPDLLQPGDARWFGSAVDLGRGLIVAASGGPADVDDLIARTVLELIRTPAILRAREAIQARGPAHPTLS
jgi:hypothetical protein